LQLALQQLPRLDGSLQAECALPTPLARLRSQTCTPGQRPLLQLKLILGIKVPRSQAVHEQLRDIFKVIHTGERE
jgi:hypothetical protein